MTRIVSFVFAAGLALASLSIANAKTYEILLPEATQAGSALIPSGQYRVTVDGTDAVFQDVRGIRSFRTAVKVDDRGPMLFPVTRISTTKGPGVDHLDAIELEGTGTRIEFGSPTHP